MYIAFWQNVCIYDTNKNHTSRMKLVYLKLTLNRICKKMNVCNETDNPDCKFTLMTSLFSLLL